MNNMTRYLIKNAIRRIVSQIRFSLINITGLVIGIVAFIAIMLWVKYEKGYDNFHANKDFIYRVTAASGVETPNAMAQAILEEVPEVESSVRYQIAPSLSFKVGDKLFFENRIALTDPDFFRLFNFPFIVGDPENSMSQAFNIILTQDMAYKYFGKEDPIGKTILIENQLPGKVTGIIKDIPRNSHMQFDCVIPYIVMKELGYNLSDWYNWNPQLYIKVRNNKNIDVVCIEIQALADKYRNNNTEKFALQALKDIHFNTGFNFDTAVTINPSYVFILSIGAFLILVISFINYINLSLALNVKRLKEVGVKRMLGAGKTIIIKQVLIETTILVSVAFLIALFLIGLIKPIFPVLLDTYIGFQPFTFELIISYIVLAIIIALITGSIPALAISSIRPDHIFNKKINSDRRKILSGKLPVVIQFSLSILLIIGAIGIRSQMYYITNTDLGFDSHNIVCLPLKSNSESKYNSLKTELLKNTEIESVSVKDHDVLGFGNTNGSLDWDGKKPDEKIWVENSYVASNYLSTMGIQLSSGRDFMEESQADSINKIIVNEQLIKRIKLDDPIGRRIKFQGEVNEIIGVIKDAHFQPLNKVIEPQVYQIINFENNIEESAQAIVKYNNHKNANSLSATIDHIRIAWEKIYPEVPFQLSFLDLQVENQYKSEKKLTLIMYIFSGISIFLSCLGLLAFSVFMAEKRTKEIGIRKVNGAKITDVLAMINKDFIKGVLFAFIIACPIAWYALHKWLQNFAYKTELSWWLFAAAGGIALVIALLTVSWQSWRVATRNPVEALRYE
jgi:putative ABC transport system permease protein